MERRIFLRWLGLGAGAAATSYLLPSVAIVGEERSVLPAATFVDAITGAEYPLVRGAVRLRPSLDAINEITTKKIVPAVADYFMKSSPLMEKIKSIKVDAYGKAIPESFWGFAKVLPIPRLAPPFERSIVNE